MSPQAEIQKRDSIKTLKNGHREIQFQMSEENYQKILELKEQLSQPGEDLT